jgi:hypothetical protein
VIPVTERLQDSRQLGTLEGKFGMNIDKRDLLTVLREELEFLNSGGYRHKERASWRPHLAFQDSPTCLNFDSTRQPRPCNECVLTHLVPKDMQTKRFPCRYIPLNERGETVDSFYRFGTQEELESELKLWLQATIEVLERRGTGYQAAEPFEIHVRATGRLAE